MTTATLVLNDDGSVDMDLQAVSLLSGVDVVDLEPFDGKGFPLAVHRNIFRRRKECSAILGVHEPAPVVQILHFARLEGVEVVGINPDGTRTVLVAAPTGDLS